MLSGNKGRPVVKAVLFDLDDTLLDSQKARVQTLAQVFTDAGITDLQADKYLFSLNGQPFREALKELGQVRNIKDDLFTKYRRAYWFKNQDSLKLYPGVREMLEELKSGGYKLGVVTSKINDADFEGRRIGCAGELRKLGIARMFSVVVGLENVTRPKPDPQCIHLALHKISIGAGETLVVGDTAVDIEAARNAGCLSCRATWGITGGPLIADGAAADFVASKPGDVVRFLAGYCN